MAASARTIDKRPARLTMDREFILRQQAAYDAHLEKVSQADSQRAERDNEADERMVADANEAVALAAEQAEQEAVEYQYFMQEARRQAFYHAKRREAEEQVEEAERSRPSLFRYSPALLTAGLKDCLDLTIVAILPGIGWAIGACLGILIFLCLLLAKTNSTLVESRFIVRRTVVFLGGTIVEVFGFGLNLFPIQTITVLVIYLMDKHLTEQQITELAEVANKLHLAR